MQYSMQLINSKLINARRYLINWGIKLINNNYERERMRAPRINLIKLELKLINYDLIKLITPSGVDQVPLLRRSTGYEGTASTIKLINLIHLINSTAKYNKAINSSQN